MEQKKTRKMKQRHTHTEKERERKGTKSHQESQRNAEESSSSLFLTGGEVFFSDDHVLRFPAKCGGECSQAGQVKKTDKTGTRSMVAVWRRPSPLILHLSPSLLRGTVTVITTSWRFHHKNDALPWFFRGSFAQDHEESLQDDHHESCFFY